MNASGWIRQVHRWMSALFTLAVVINFAVLGMAETPIEWVYYLPLPFLFVLLGTGIYMFLLPYFRTKRRQA